MKLGTLLLRNAAISLTQLEAALRNQVLYGGRLGTNLVELGFLDLETLSTYLAELGGHPVATATLLEDADAELAARLGADDAHRLRAIPLGYLGDGQASIAVALVDVADHAALTELTVRLGGAITPYVVPELRALYYLEKLYGLPRGQRYVRSGRDAAPEVTPAAPDERRRAQPAGGIVMPPPFTMEPARRRHRTSNLPFGTTVAPAMTYAGACERIDTAATREVIGDTFVEYARGRCDALVVFLVRDGNALGWRGWVAPPLLPTRGFEDLSLPLGGASALQTARDTGQVFLGEPPGAARPVETALWAALGVASPPAHVLVVPIAIKQQAINLVYAHSQGGPPPASVVSELTDLATRAQASYVRLIHATSGA